MNGLYILGGGNFEKIYGPSEQHDIAQMVNIYAPPQTPAAVQASPGILQQADVIFSGWGGPTVDRAFLEAAPHLKAFFYGAGATGSLIHQAAYDRGVRVTSAQTANSIPVAEYTTAAILLSLKHFFRFARQTRERGAFGPRTGIPGAYQTTVGLVSLGVIGRMVRERLRASDVRVVAYDPFVSAGDAQAENIEPVGLEELFRVSNVVSVHTPWLPETEGMITGAHIASLPHGATFINTARGAVIRERELIEIARLREDLDFILDVTYPEPPPPASPLYSLPNVMLTPHIAGSMEAECRRMGRYMVDELRRFVNGEPMLYEIRPDAARHSSHRPPAP